MIRIDNEFKNLIPPLSEDEYKQLEQNILDYGIRDDLVTAVYPDSDGEVLIDGHNRYAIASKHGLTYKTTRLDFQSRSDVLVWIIDNQLGRRNLNAYNEGLLNMKKNEYLSVMAKENQAMYYGNQHEKRTFDQMNKSPEPIHVRKITAQQTGISESTLHRIKTIDSKAPESIKEKARSGEISINQAYNMTKPVTTLKRESILQTAKEGHENFEKEKESGMVKFDSIRKENENLKILSDNVYFSIASCITKISKISKYENLSRLISLMDSNTIGDLSVKLNECQESIDTLRKEIVTHHERQ